MGTSKIDNDGEDLASKGRILLFQVKKSKKKMKKGKAQIAKLPRRLIQMKRLRNIKYK